MATTDDPLDVLVKAIKTAWTANAATLTTLGTPTRSEKPPIVSSGFPYVVIVTEPSVLDRWACDNEYWDHSVRFWAYDITPELCATHANLIRSVFDPESLTLTLSVGSVIRKRSSRSEYVQQDQNVWRASVPYDFYTSRPRSP